jgi:hypothetical protein
MRRKVKIASPAPTPAVRQIRQAMAAMTLVCAGTLLKRWKLCGRPNCRCAQDPAARHGPYYEWSRRQDGRLRHSLLSAQQAELLAQGIRNHHQILALLARWSLETAHILKIPTNPK